MQKLNELNYQEKTDIKNKMLSEIQVRYSSATMQDVESIFKIYAENNLTLDETFASLTECFKRTQMTYKIPFGIEFQKHIVRLPKYEPTKAPSKEKIYSDVMDTGCLEYFQKLKPDVRDVKDLKPVAQYSYDGKALENVFITYKSKTLLIWDFYLGCIDPFAPDEKELKRERIEGEIRKQLKQGIKPSEIFRTQMNKLQLKAVS